MTDLLEIYFLSFIGWILYNAAHMNSKIHLFDLNNDGLDWQETKVYLKKYFLWVFITGLSLQSPTTI